MKFDHRFLAVVLQLIIVAALSIQLQDKLVLALLQVLLLAFAYVIGRSDENEELTKEGANIRTKIVHEISEDANSVVIKEYDVDDTNIGEHRFIRSSQFLSKFRKLIISK